MDLLDRIVDVERDWYGVAIALVVIYLVTAGVDVAW